MYLHLLPGLDPALPLFTLGNKDARLDKHDAKHVEVIHTCGGYLGFSSPLGHIDFYPNGGTRQPGCGWDYRGKVTPVILICSELQFIKVLLISINLLYS